MHLNEFQRLCMTTAEYRNHPQFDAILSDLGALQDDFQEASEAGIEELKNANETMKNAMELMTHQKLLLDLTYAFDGLAGETGEAIEKKKKLIRNQGGMFASKEEANLNPKLITIESLSLELGDIMWYIAAVAEELGTDLETICQITLDKLADRKKRNVIKSAGDNR